MTTQSFSAWLHDQHDRDDEVGALAGTTSAAGDLPEHGGKAIYDGYFESGTDEDRERFERAWMEFEANSQPSSTSDRPDGFR